MIPPWLLGCTPAPRISWLFLEIRPKTAGLGCPTITLGMGGEVNKILLSSAETNCSSVAWQMGPKRETICFQVKP